MGKLRPSGASMIRQISPIRQIAFLHAPNAASQWLSAWPRPARTPATSSGVARRIPIAKEPHLYNVT